MFQDFSRDSSQPSDPVALPIHYGASVCAPVLYEAMVHMAILNELKFIGNSTLEFHRFPHGFRTSSQPWYSADRSWPQRCKGPHWHCPVGKYGNLWFEDRGQLLSFWWSSMRAAQDVFGESPWNFQRWMPLPSPNLHVVSDWRINSHCLDETWPCQQWTTPQTKPA